MIAFARHSGWVVWDLGYSNNICYMNKDVKGELLNQGYFVVERSGF